MSGFNEKLPLAEKIQCLMCLSSNAPIETIDGHEECPDCGASSPNIWPQMSKGPDELAKNSLNS